MWLTGKTFILESGNLMSKSGTKHFFPEKSETKLLESGTKLFRYPGKNTNKRKKQNKNMATRFEKIPFIDCIKANRALLKIFLSHYDH